MIRGHGNDSALVMLVTDVASEHDINQGYALTGQDEFVLRRCLRPNGLHFDEMWKTALIKERGNLKKPQENRPLLTDEYRRILDNEIETIRPNLICPLSELSFNYLTGLNGIRKYRGSVLPALCHPTDRFIRILPILGVNPYINEDPKQEIITRIDAGKILRNQSKTEPIAPEGNLWIAKSPAALRAFLQRSLKGLPPFLVFDIETYLNIPTCISLCFDGIESVTVPFFDFEIEPDCRYLMMKEVATLLASPIPKVNQNIKFDWKHLERFGFSVRNVIGDTMIGMGCLYPEFPKNLGFQISIYTDMPYHKDEAKDLEPNSRGREQFYLYCAKDSLGTHRIYTQQQTELDETRTTFVYQKLIEVMPIYKQMEERGIRIDGAERKRLRVKYQSLFEIYSYKLGKLVGETLNPLSSKRIQSLVYEELGYKPVRGVKYGKSGNPGADEESLEMLLWKGTPSTTKNARAILLTIINCRKLHKVIEILELDLHPDKRFRCEYNLVGTETGRTSAGQTPDYFIKFDEKGKVTKVNLGHSLQTIGKHGFQIDGVDYGKDIRSMFVPSRGYSFVECDLSGAEARVDAVLARDFEILSLFDDGLGIHRHTGSWVYGCSPNQIKKGQLVLNEHEVAEDRYHIAKTVRHAAERNVKEDRLSIMLGQEVIRCAKILKIIHDKQPNIREVYHREIRERIQKTRTLVCPNGRRREFYGRIDDHTFNEGISFIPQAVVSDQLKFSFIRTYSETPWAFPLAEAHDGHLAEVPIGRESEFYSIFKRNVEIGIDFRKGSLERDYELVIPCEGETGLNWRDMKEIQL
jgi:uracil-DNA glycosylase family 4